LEDRRCLLLLVCCRPPRRYLSATAQKTFSVTIEGQDARPRRRQPLLR
jgi:hypothetical protein